MANYSYPRVELNTVTKKHSAVRPGVEDTTSLLAMCISEKGPTEGLIAVHSLAEFIDIFGNLSYDDNSQTALNIYNWLSNNGTAYVKRFPSARYVETVKYSNGNKEIFESKYPGKYYHDLTIKIEVIAAASPRYTITILSGGAVVEKFYRMAADKVADAISGSDLIVALSEALTAVDGGLFDTTIFEPGNTYTLTNSALTPAAQTADYELEAQIRSYIYGSDGEGEAYTDLQNKLLAPVEVVLGAGYSKETDTALVKLLELRDDLIIILDNHQLPGKLVRPIDKDYADTDHQSNHVCIENHYFVQYDNAFTSRNIYVTLTYYLSQLIPYNDTLYGIQHPVAGLRRGVLSSPQSIDENLTPRRKEELFKARINYVEKTTREYAIMSQRTHDGSTEDEYDALSFMNNVRTLERMKKEIERLARNYLFEFNDSTTLTQLKNVLNKYITEWISNRTLAYGYVDVAKDEYSDERLNVTLNVRFNGTIEVIHVDIVID